MYELSRYHILSLLISGRTDDCWLCIPTYEQPERPGCLATAPKDLSIRYTSTVIQYITRVDNNSVLPEAWQLQTS